MKIGFVSLGCSKNLVDTEMMIGYYQEKGHEIVANPIDAEIIVINTCGFIESAKKEAIDTILEMADYKEKHNIKKMMLAIAFLWTEQKGYMYIKRIAERIKKPWTLVVIGVDKKQARELRQYNVVTLPRISDDNELAKWYSTADVFINPTLEDNFPTVNIEAISCGTPCVTFDTGGAGEIIDSNTGGVIEKGNWEKMLKEAIEINKQNMQKECVKRAIDRYNREKMEKEYISLYKTMKSRG